MFEPPGAESVSRSTEMAVEEGESDTDWSSCGSDALHIQAPTIGKAFSHKRVRSMPTELSVPIMSAQEGWAAIDAQERVAHAGYTKQLRNKLKNRLHDAQVALLQQTEERRATYTYEGAPTASAAARSSDTARRHSAPVTFCVPEDGEGLATPPQSSSRRRAYSESLQVRVPPLKRFTQKAKRGIAYMGIDWYKVQQRRRKISWLFILQNLYYWCYAGYIVILTLIGTLAMWALEPDGNLSFGQAFYSSAACASGSGLAIVDWSTQARSTYAVSFLLIIFSSAPLLHTVPVILRIHSFRMQTRITHMMMGAPAIASRAVQRRGSLGGSASPKGLTRCSSDPCSNHSFVSWPMDFEREESTRSIAPLPAGKQIKYARSFDDMHRLEYKALKKILKITLGYWLVVHAIGSFVFYMYFHFGSGPIQDNFHATGISTHWHAVYLTVSAFQNTGLVMTQFSVIEFSHSPLVLNVIATLILLGNTCYPIMIRFITWAMKRYDTAGSENQRVLQFLLEHPRRCFTHMFPAVHTLWLLIVVVTLIALHIAVVIWQDMDSPAMEALDGSDKFWNVLFQAFAIRSAGLTSINTACLSQGTTFFMLVTMYVAATPTVVIMRSSAVLPDGRRGELDITGRAEGIDEDIIKGDNSLKTQARRYLTQDVTYLTAILFLICVFEKDKFERSAHNISRDCDGIYGDFSFFKVLFEIMSAYGTCGLTLGYQNQIMSFSGVWCFASQFLLVVVMIMGRLRGLPDSIDPSVRVAMAPGENKEQTFLHA